MASTDSFVDITTGEVITTAGIVQDMINYYKTAYYNGNTQITDFNEGSEVRNFLEAVANTVYDIRYFINELIQNGNPFDTSGPFLDLLGLFVGCYRQQAEYATGNIQFTTQSIKTYDIDIPQGTEMDTSGQSTVGFVTAQDATLTAGQTSVIIPIIAVMPGSDGNVAANKITVMTDMIEDLTCNNTAATSEGVDQEDDLSFQGRIIEAGKGNSLGSIEWYKSVTENLIGVHDAVIISNPGGQSSTVEIIVNGTTKPTPQSVLSAVLAQFLQDNYNVAGINVEVTSPNYNVVNIAANIKLMTGATWSTVQSNIQTNLNAYFNGGTTEYGTSYPGINTGDSAGVVVSTIQLILKNTTGVLDYSLTSPSTNIALSSTTAAQLGTITLTQV